MDAPIWFLIITSATHINMQFDGVGGAAVTPTQSEHQCQVLKRLVLNQLSSTVSSDTSDVIITCQPVARE